MNKDLLKRIDIFVNKLLLTSIIKDRLKEILIRYENCRIKKLNNYPLRIEEIDKKRWLIHLIGFLDGSGHIKSGKRVGHKKGLFRFVPRINIELTDLYYLNLIKKMLNLPEDKKIYFNSTKKTSALTFSSRQELNFIMGIIDENQCFLSQKKSRDYLLLKELLVYIDDTKLITHDLIWVNKGLEKIKDLNTYNNLPSNEKILNGIKRDISLDYILGYIEAEGSLTLNYNLKKDYIFNTFEITQNKANDLILWGILDFIKEYNNPLIIKDNIEIQSKGIIENNSKSKKHIISHLVLTDNEVLFSKIIPLMISSDLYSNMQIKLVYWIFGVIISKDLKHSSECLNLYLKIKEAMNSNSRDLLDLNEILIILNKYL